MSSINQSLKFLKIAVQNRPVSKSNQSAILRSDSDIAARKNELIGAIERFNESPSTATEEYARAAKRAKSYLRKHFSVTV